jgi:hypothetical protein
LSKIFALLYFPFEIDLSLLRAVKEAFHSSWFEDSFWGGVAEQMNLAVYYEYNHVYKFRIILLTEQ